MVQINYPYLRWGISGEPKFFYSIFNYVITEKILCDKYEKMNRQR